VPSHPALVPITNRFFVFFLSALRNERFPLRALLAPPIIFFSDSVPSPFGMSAVVDVPADSRINLRQSTCLAGPSFLTLSVTRTCTYAGLLLPAAATPVFSFVSL